MDYFIEDIESLYEQLDRIAVCPSLGDESFLQQAWNFLDEHCHRSEPYVRDYLDKLEKKLTDARERIIEWEHEVEEQDRLQRTKSPSKGSAPG